MPNKVSLLVCLRPIKNYTCQSGVWTSVGAVAALYDASCLVDTPHFDQIAKTAFSVDPKIDGCNAVHAKLDLPGVGVFEPLANHFFVPNPVAGGTGVSPRFDLAGTTSFTTLKKVGVSPSAQDDICHMY
jgi:hypothetical protein